MPIASWRRVAVVAAVIAAGVVANIVVLSHGGGGGDGSGAAGSAGSGSGGAGHGPVVDHPPELPRVPTGSASLSGFVVDGAGLPIAGAEVTAELEKMKAMDGPGSGGSAGSAGSGSAAAAGSVAVAPPTPADGRFSIAGLAAGRYRLHVTGPGLLAAELRFVQVPSDATRIVVSRQIAIDGTVTDEGKPAPGAHVGIRSDDIGGAIEVVADGSGAFHVPDLPEGRYQVYAYQDDYAARAIRVQRLGSGPFGPVELKLEKATIVVGRVLDRDEGTGVIAAVELRPTGDDQAPRYARTGDDGVFRIEGVPRGRWIAEAFAPGYLSAAGIELEAGHGIPELQLALGGTLEGRVIDADGQPIDGAVVRAVAGGASASTGSAAAAADTTTQTIEVSELVDQDHLRRYSGRTPAAATTPTSGLLAPGLDPELLPRGELGVMLGPIPPLPPPGGVIAHPATLVASDGGSGSGGATGAGARLAGEPDPLKVDPDHASIYTTGADGRYRIRGVPRGTFTVLAQADGFAEARGKPVAVAPPEVHRDIDVVVTAGVILVGHVTDQHGAVVIGAQVSAQPIDLRGAAHATADALAIGAPVEGFSDAGGDFRVGPVTGAIRLHVGAYGHVDVERAVELPPAHGRAVAEHREDVVLDVADAELAGDVEDDTGTPVSAANLAVVGGAGDGRHAISGADGTFSFDLLPPGPIHLVVEHPQFPPTEVDAVASTAGSAPRARVVLPIGGAVEGVLLDHATGAPLSGIALAGTGPRSAAADANTDKAGRWRLGPLRAGHWHVVVKQPGYLQIARDLDVPAAHAPGGTSVRDVRLELAQGAIVGGTVRDSTGHRVAGAHVTVRALDGSGVTVDGDSDASGEFRLVDCPTGELDLAADKGDAHGTIRATVRPADEVTSLQIDIR
jgi:hypothetical protein|nr:carboxypeptidase-like regulatory domain-containing protein [Kofleriaceae bacterium]